MPTGMDALGAFAGGFLDGFMKAKQFELQRKESESQINYRNQMLRIQTQKAESATKLKPITETQRFDTEKSLESLEHDKRLLSMEIKEMTSLVKNLPAGATLDTEIGGGKTVRDYLSAKDKAVSESSKLDKVIKLHRDRLGFGDEVKLKPTRKEQGTILSTLEAELERRYPRNKLMKEVEYSKKDSELNKLQKMSDDDLIILIQKGDLNAIAELARRYPRRLQ